MTIFLMLKAGENIIFEACSINYRNRFIYLGFIFTCSDLECDYEPQLIREEAKCRRRPFQGQVGGRTSVWLLVLPSVLQFPNFRAHVIKASRTSEGVTAPACKVWKIKLNTLKDWEARWAADRCTTFQRIRFLSQYEAAGLELFRLQGGPRVALSQAWVSPAVSVQNYRLYIV